VGEHAERDAPKILSAVHSASPQKFSISRLIKRKKRKRGKLFPFLLEKKREMPQTKRQTWHMKDSPRKGTGRREGFCGKKWGGREEEGLVSWRQRKEESAPICKDCRYFTVESTEFPY